MDGNAMIELDFLPEWYHVRQQRRRSTFVLIWLAASLLGVIALWFTLANSQIRQARRDLETLKAERTAVNDHLVKIDKLRAIRDDLLRKSTIAAKLHGQPDAIHAISRVLELMPEGVGLVSLDLQTEPIKSPAASAPARPQRIGGRAATSAPEPGPRPDRTRYLIKLTCVAPVDEVVSAFLNRLSNAEDFERNVQVGYVNDFKQGGRLMRKFELTCRLMENWSPAQDEGLLARADPSPQPASEFVAAVGTQE